jgi:hypothetical protein
VFNVTLYERCTVTLQSKDVSWTINDVLLAGITNDCEDQVVKCCANAWMRVADLLGP